jgi:hypothetical protein
MTHIFVHYHLRPGGVTRVMLQQAAAFQRMGLHCLTISSGPFDHLTGRHRCLPALDYADAQNLRWADLRELVKDLPQPWIWHVHNPTLGCHPDMASVIQNMAHAGERLILHLHDFAEEDRPQNLQRLSAGPPWFPVGERIHYVVLTTRDRDILRNAGLAANRVTVIGNPILPQPFPMPQSKSAQIIYPTRAITRKNMGEMLLLAALSPAGARFATTLGPGKSLHQSSYEHWQNVAQVLDLPVDWAVTESAGCSTNFGTQIRHATHLISTSMQEGFGMAFWEAIAWQRPLIGRAIPHIEEHLADHGIRHPHLYHGIFVDSLEFSQQSVTVQTELLERAMQDPTRVQVRQGNRSVDAVSWLALALSPEHKPLPLSLLDPFHPDQHARAVDQIAQSLKNAAASDISQLDAEVIRLSFRKTVQAHV